MPTLSKAIKAAYILKSSSSSSSNVFTSCSGRDTMGSKWGSWLVSSAVESWSSCSWNGDADGDSTQNKCLFFFKMFFVLFCFLKLICRHSVTTIRHVESLGSLTRTKWLDNWTNRPWTLQWRDLKDHWSSVAFVRETREAFSKSSAADSSIFYSIWGCLVPCWLVKGNEHHLYG